MKKKNCSRIYLQLLFSRLCNKRSLDQFPVITTLISTLCFSKFSFQFFQVALNGCCPGKHAIIYHNSWHARSLAHLNIHTDTSRDAYRAEHPRINTYWECSDWKLYIAGCGSSLLSSLADPERHQCRDRGSLKSTICNDPHMN